VDYPLPFRARRIVDRLSGGERWGPEDVEELQRDTRSLLADRLADRAEAAARRAGREEAARLLSAWDHRVDRGSRAAGVFYAWAYRLRSLVAADEYRTTSEWGHFPMSALLRVLAGAPGSTAWIDDVTTDSAESLEGLEERALRDAAGATGLRPWGELHRERHGHPLGRVGWLDRLFGFDVGPYPSPGAPRTVRPDDYMRWRPLDERSWRPPWINDYGPSERLVVSLGPGGPEGWFLLPTGQSGNPLDPHYRDMSGRWREGGAMIRLPLDPDEVAARATRSLTLAPGGTARGGPGDR
jgi:penicillin amidase